MFQYSSAAVHRRAFFTPVYIHLAQHRAAVLCHYWAIFKNIKASCSRRGARTGSAAATRSCVPLVRRGAIHGKNFFTKTRGGAKASVLILRAGAVGCTRVDDWQLVCVLVVRFHLCGLLKRQQEVISELTVEMSLALLRSGVKHPYLHRYRTKEALHACLHAKLHEGVGALNSSLALFQIPAHHSHQAFFEVLRPVHGLAQRRDEEVQGPAQLRPALAKKFFIHVGGR